MTGPGFGDERGAGVPLAAHAETEEKTEEAEDCYASRKATGEREERIGEDAHTEQAAAAQAVGEEAEEKAAEGGADERESVQSACHGFGHAELAHQGGEHERVEHDIEGIEHPAEAGGDDGAALWRGSVAPAKGKNGRGVQDNRIVGEGGES